MSECKSCGAEIIWLKTVNGKNIPVDAETCSSKDELFDPDNMTAHFVTCPEADEWRKR
jgi:predicted RNA-binding Zn-ribbon protein involved in translation (DUF1610 family)